MARQEFSEDLKPTLKEKYEGCPSKHAAKPTRSRAVKLKNSMYYIYALQSLPFAVKTYIGFTENLGARLEAHNEGKSPHTSKYKPWKVKFYCAFEDREKALEFERYLKSGSGKSFLFRRLF